MSDQLRHSSRPKKTCSLAMTSGRNRSRLDWEDIKFFTILARHRTLSATARVLSVNHATVSRRVLSLEEAFGEKLVERRPDGYALTDAGLRAITAAHDMESAADTFTRGGVDQ